MGRKKKIKINEKESKEKIDTVTKTTEAITDSGSSTNDESMSNSSEPDFKFEPEQPHNNTGKEKDILNLLGDFNSENTETEEVIERPENEKRTRKPRKSKLPERAQMKVPGKLFLAMHSKIIVSLVGFADRFSKNPIPEEYIAHVGLTDEDINDEEFIQLAEAAIRDMKIEDKPIPVFYATLAGMVITNYMTLSTFLKKQQKQKEEAAPAPEIKL